MLTVNYWADDLEAAKAWYSELLGIEPYFAVPGPDQRPIYCEFRIGDAQDELGLVDRRFAPGGAADAPAGVILYWHVDDLHAAFERLLALGAAEHEPPTPRGDAGFITASVIDPFGNILGIMHNPHYLKVLRDRGQE